MARRQRRSGVAERLTCGPPECVVAIGDTRYAWNTRSCYHHETLPVDANEVSRSAVSVLERSCQED